MLPSQNDFVICVQICNAIPILDISKSTLTLINNPSKYRNIFSQHYEVFELSVWSVQGFRVTYAHRCILEKTIAADGTIE